LKEEKEESEDIKRMKGENIPEEESRRSTLDGNKWRKK